MIAFLPAVRSAVMLTSPPGLTLIGKCSQAPAFIDVLMLAVRDVVPSSTVTVWRRSVVSQSSA